MFDKPEIILLKGFCSLSFGESKENVIKKFGEPEEIQNLTDDILIIIHWYTIIGNLASLSFFDTNKNQAFCMLRSTTRKPFFLRPGYFH